MRLITLLGILSISLLFTSCEDYSDQRIMSSGGGIDEILVVLNNEDVQTPFSDTIATYFTNLYPGLPQDEPRFDLNIRSYRQFNEGGDLLKKYRNVIFAASLDKEGPVSNLIRTRLGEEHLERLRNDTTFFYALQRNVFAQPQLVVYIFAQTQDQLISRLDQHQNQIFKVIADSENQRLQNEIYAFGENNTIRKQVEDKFGISMKIPTNYVVAAEDNDFIWIAKDQVFTDRQNDIVRQINQNILIKSFPLDENRSLLNLSSVHTSDIDVRQFPVILRDSIGGDYVFGVDETFTMHTDVIRPIYQDSITLDNYQVLQTRGLWRMRNPFMGGPFVNYAIIDETNNRLIIIDVFVYGAGSTKRRLVREMENIVNTLSLNIQRA